jgi:predicted  nucleic acid-binding Zn-ribbon protein
MPKTALADTLMEWDSLLTALDQSEILAQPHIQELRDELSAMLKSVRALTMEQSSLQARRQAVTQQLRIARSQGKDLVVKVRSAVRSVLGHRNEGLVRYRIRPVRRRSRAVREEVGIVTLAAIPDET